MLVGIPLPSPVLSLNSRINKCSTPCGKTASPSPHSVFFSLAYLTSFSSSPPNIYWSSLFSAEGILKISPTSIQFGHSLAQLRTPTTLPPRSRLHSVLPSLLCSQAQVEAERTIRNATATGSHLDAAILPSVSISPPPCHQTALAHAHPTHRLSANEQASNGQSI